MTRPSWEANSSSATHKIPPSSWTQKACYYHHYNLSLVQSTPSHLPTLLYTSTVVTLFAFPVRFPYQISMYIWHHTHVASSDSSSFLLPNSNNVQWRYKFWSFSLHSFHLFPANLHHLQPHNQLTTLFSKMLCLQAFIKGTDFHTRTKQYVTIHTLHTNL